MVCAPWLKEEMLCVVHRLTFCFSSSVVEARIKTCGKPTGKAKKFCF